MSRDPNKPLVLRVEISAEQAERFERLLAPAVAAPAFDPPSEPDFERRVDELAEREARLTAQRESLLDQERLLDQRMAEVHATDGLTASEKIRLAQRTKRVAEAEQELEERTQDLEHREDALHAREAEFEADVTLREERIEEWRAELGELERRLERKETELMRYVGELQGAIARGDETWWQPADAADGLIQH